MSRKLDRPLFVAFVISSSGIYIFNIRSSTLQHHIKCEYSDINHVIAFDGKQILVYDNKFYTICMDDNEIKILGEDKQCQRHYRCGKFESTEQYTDIIPKRVLFRGHEDSRRIRSGAFYSVEHSPYIDTEEKCMIAPPYSDDYQIHMQYLCDKYLDSNDAAYFSCFSYWYSRGYYYITTFSNRLGIFERIGDTYYVVWIFKDIKNITDNWFDPTQISTATVLDVPKSTENVWKDFRQQVFGYLKNYLLQDLSNVVADYV